MAWAADGGLRLAPRLTNAMRLTRRCRAASAAAVGGLAQPLGVEVGGLAGADQRDAWRRPAGERRQEELVGPAPEFAAVGRSAKGAAGGLVQASHRRRGALAFEHRHDEQVGLRCPRACRT